MNTQPMQDAEAIIQNHVWFSLVPGFLPVPVIDVMGITAVQLDMIKQLCHVYGKDYDEQRGKALATGLAGTATGRMSGYAMRAAFKVVPGIGWVLGGLTLSASAAASTYALGQIFKEHFEEGGTLQTIDVEHIRQFFDKQLEEGRKFVDRLLEKKGKGL